VSWTLWWKAAGNPPRFPGAAEASRSRHGRDCSSTRGDARLRSRRPDRMTGEEGGERFGHGARMLNVQQMGGVGEHEALRLRQPGQDHLVTLAPDGRYFLALRADHGQ